MHPLCSSSSDIMPNIAAHTFSSEGNSKNSITRNMREPVSITTVTTKDDFITERYKDNKFKSYRYISYQYIFY